MEVDARRAVFETVPCGIEQRAHVGRVGFDTTVDISSYGRRSIALATDGFEAILRQLHERPQQPEQVAAVVDRGEQPAHRGGVRRVLLRGEVRQRQVLADQPGVLQPVLTQFDTFDQHDLEGVRPPRRVIR